MKSKSRASPHRLSGTQWRKTWRKFSESLTLLPVCEPYVLSMSPMMRIMLPGALSVYVRPCGQACWSMVTDSTSFCGVSNIAMGLRLFCLHGSIGARDLCRK